MARDMTLTLIAQIDGCPVIRSEWRYHGTLKAISIEEQKEAVHWAIVDEADES